MIRSRQIDMLKSMVDERDANTLMTYLDIAGEKILSVAYPFKDDVTEVPSKYHGLQIEIAVYMLNKRGGEGQTVHNENGIERAYDSSDIPLDLLRKIVPEAGVL